MEKRIILQLVVIVAAVSILSVTQKLALSADSAYLQSSKTSDLANKIRQGEVRYRWGKAEIIYDQPEKLQQDFDQARKSQTRWENGSIRISKKWPFGWNCKKTRTEGTRSCGTGLTMESRKSLTSSPIPLFGNDWASAF